MVAICDKHSTESVVTKTATGCIVSCTECMAELSSNDSNLLDWLESVGGEIQFSNASCKWWVNWYAGVDGSEHKSGLMFDSVREALKSAFLGNSDT